MQRGTIWLVGMMGAGKSAVGAELAARLGLPFADTDVEVEQAAGASVAEIFEREGETAFRARERDAIAKWAGRQAVVALGGGAVAQAGTGERLAASGVTVWLRARPTTLAARTARQGSERPLLAGLDPEGRRDRLGALLAEREPAYAAARIVLDTDEGSPAELAEQLAGRLSAEDQAHELPEGTP